MPVMLVNRDFLTSSVENVWENVFSLNKRVKSKDLEDKFPSSRLGISA